MIRKKSIYYSFLAFSLIVFNLFWEAANAQTIYLEWVDDPLKSMVINWVDQAGGESSVDYRRVGSGNWSSEGGNSQSIPGDGKRLYRVKLNGLSAGQAYEFRIEGDSQIYKFRTAPEDLDDPLRFIVGGDLLDNKNPRNDFENSKDSFDKVSKIAASQDPYFAVLAGDLAHADGNEDLVDQWFDFFELWHDNMVTDDGFLIPIAASPGNHEVPNAYGDSPEDAIYYYTFFSYPQDQWDSKISYGKLDFSNYLSIVTLDTDHTHRIPGTQTNWLNNTLKNRRNFRHVIPAYHVAGWPAFRTLVGTQENLVRNNWHKIFRQNDIRLVFEHHDHIYKRTVTIGDCENEISNELHCDFGNKSKDGVIYMGGGAWGSENSRSVNPSPNNQWYLDETEEENHNFVLVEITNNYRKATAIGEDGNEIDSFTDFVFLDPPEALSAEVTDDSFTARWKDVEGADKYFLSIYTDEDLEDIFRGFNNKNVGNVNEFEVEDLDPSVIYYYNVKAGNVLTTSKASDEVIVQLVKIDPDLSTISSSKEIVEANEEETSTITAIIFDEDGERVPNFRVTLFAEEGNLRTDDKTVRTTNDGEAAFEVFNDQAEIVTYGVLAGSEEISGRVEVTFIPRSPVVLTASNVKNREFTANWEMVDGTDYYELDVAADENFANVVPGYEALNVGEVTSATVSGVNPGTEYFYRVRAVTDNLIGVNSEITSTTTFPDTPVAVESSAESVVSFTANWNAAEGAENYLLDVSSNSNFDSYIDGYQEVNVGNVVSYDVEDLLSGKTYYYRVRSEAGPRLSEYSNTMNVTTLEIDTENSEIEPDQLRVLANGEQSNQVYVTILAKDGSLQQGVTVQLTDENGNSEINGESVSAQLETNEEGTATFGVTNTNAEKVTYSVAAAGVNVGSIELEFLENEGVLTLGNNFPNPFRFETSIPLTVPNAMDVKLEIFNSIGAPVRKLIDDKVETGYYEVPFNGADLAAGVYFYRLLTEEGTKTGKMVLVK